MIHLDIGLTSSQTILVTLNEKLPCDTDCYIPVFFIENQLTFESKYFTSVDISEWPSRYNLFEITIVGSTASENVNNGELYFTQSQTGQWTYRVYNQECVDAFNMVAGALSGYYVDSGMLYGGRTWYVLQGADPGTEGNPFNCCVYDIGFGGWVFAGPEDASGAYYASFEDVSDPTLCVTWDDLGGSGPLPLPVLSVGINPDLFINVLETGYLKIT